MNKRSGLALAALAVAAALAAGYGLGKRQTPPGAAASSPAAAAAPAQAAKKLLYYRNPMGLPDTSPVPKKDPMGMDYVPVYAGEDDADPAAAAQIRISAEKVQKLGVRTEAASLRSLDRTVRASGRIEPDERRLFTIAPKFEGYVERLHVNVTGQTVARGEALFEAYSPELVSAQREYLIATEGLQSLKDAGDEAQASMKRLAESSMLRLKNWDISEEQIAALSRSREVRRTLSFRSPATGIVTEKKAVQGLRFMPGEALYQVADLASVWVVADVFEQDIGLVALGARAKISIAAYPDKLFEGKVSYVYPTLKAETRTVQVRVDLPNPGLKLKPAMYAQVELAAAGRGKVLALPLSAVIDSGTRQIVLVQLGEGRFEPRQVRLGARSEDYVEVLSGVTVGEPVVVAANFLIDAESNLKAAVGGFAAPQAPAPAAAAGHRAEGTVDSVDSKGGALNVRHEPVASLKWPAMTMEFQLANEALGKDVRPGSRIAFEFVERKPGEWVITKLTPLASAQRATGR